MRNANDTGCFVLPTSTVRSASWERQAELPEFAFNRQLRFAYPGYPGRHGWLYLSRVVTSPKYGRLQYQATYSYLQKDTWSGILTGTTAAPLTFGSGKAENNMVHVSMRYYIP